MRWLSRLMPGRRDREIREEVEAHLRMAIRDRIAAGQTPEEARYAALRELGNVDQVREATRGVWSSTWLEQLVEDVRFGGRILWHSPGLSASAIVLVALVIGGNTTIYSIVHGQLTSPAVGVTADRIVGIAQTGPDLARWDPFTSYPNYRDYADRATTVDHFTAWIDDRLTLGVDDGAHAVFGASVTPGFFETFGIAIARGRAFRADDDRLEAGSLVAIVSDRIWRERFQQAPDVIGRTLTVNGHTATIVGVTSPGFRGVNLTPPLDLWLPIRAFYETIGSRQLLTNRRNPGVLMAGRLVPGASLADTRAEMTTLAGQLRSAYPDENKDRHAVVFEYSATGFSPFTELAPRFLAVFSVVTVLTLLIVSANVANLMLARAIVRQRETAVRQSLGASRGRIVRMLVAEGAAVSLAAWAAACLWAWWLSRVLRRLLPPSRQNMLLDITPDWQVLAYAMALAILATIAFTLAPALRTWRQPVLPWLKAGEQGIARGRSRLSSGLVVVQLAFSVLLLTSAGLAWRSLSLLDSGDVGFTHENLLVVTVRTGRTVELTPDRTDPVDRAASFTLLERLRERLGEVRDVESVTYARLVPGPYFRSPGPVWRMGDTESVPALMRPIGPGYLRVLGLTPVAGRDVEEHDRHGSTRIAVINEYLATALFPGRSPLGETLQLGRARDAGRRETVEIVGVAPNASFDGPSHNPRPFFVFVAEQQVTDAATTEPRFLVRHRGSLESLAPAVGKAVADLDGKLPIVAMLSMTAQLETVNESERLIATLLVFFAAGSLVVATLGQYAIAMFNMRRRTRDFGIRLSLGASAAQIQRAVVREALRLTVIGLVSGFALSVAVGLAFRSVLFGITPTDPATYAGVFALLAIVSIVASYLPAWRAGQVNVVEALRQE